MTLFSSNQANVLQRLMCLLLCVCSWNGPMPLLHNHESLRLSGLLPQHLSCFHRACKGTESSGLHWHFASVRDIYGEGDTLPNAPSECIDEALFACATVGARSAGVIRCEAAWDGDVSLEVGFASTDLRVRMVRPPGGARTFLGTIQQDVPLRTVTCVYVI